MTKNIFAANESIEHFHNEDSTTTLLLPLRCPVSGMVDLMHGSSFNPVPWKNWIRKLTIVAAVLVTLTVSPPCVAQSPVLSTKAATKLVKPYYDALLALTPAGVRSNAESVTAATWQNCTDQDICETREAAITRWSGLRKLIPDLQLEIREVLVAGNKIIVRGEMTGTPAGHSFMGFDPQGRSFRMMTIDIHDIAGGKIIHSYHMEDWLRGLNQLHDEKK